MDAESIVFYLVCFSLILGILASIFRTIYHIAAEEMNYEFDYIGNKYDDVVLYGLMFGFWFISIPWHLIKWFFKLTIWLIKKTMPDNTKESEDLSEHLIERDSLE